MTERKAKATALNATVAKGKSEGREVRLEPYEGKSRRLLCCEGLYDDVVGVAAGGEHGEERWGAVVALQADDGDVAGTGVDGEEQVFVFGEGDGVRVGAGADAGDETAVVDAVEAGGVGTEVGDPEAGVIVADDGSRWLGADDVSAADVVGPGGDFGDAVGVEVGGEDFTAVWFEGEMGGGFADVEESQKLVVLQRAVLLAAPRVGRGG